MAEVKITFIRDYQPKAAGSELFKKGRTISVSEASAAHFMSRGVAVSGRAAKEAKAREAKVEADAEAATESPTPVATEAESATESPAATEAEAAAPAKRLDK